MKLSTCRGLNGILKQKKNIGQQQSRANLLKQKLADAIIQPEAWFPLVQLKERQWYLCISINKRNTMYYSGYPSYLEI